MVDTPTRSVWRVRTAVIAVLAAFFAVMTAVPAAAHPGFIELSIQPVSAPPGEQASISVSGTVDANYPNAFIRIDATATFFQGGVESLDQVASIVDCSGTSGPCSPDGEGGITMPFGNLTAGQELNATLTIEIRPEAQPEFFWLTYRMVSGKTVFDEHIDFDAPFEIEGPGEADLAVSVSDSADPVALGGDPYTYDLLVANNGPGEATDVAVSTTLSGASVTIDDASPVIGSCTVTAPTVDCDLTTLGSLELVPVTITVTPTETGTVTATATVSATEPDATPANNTDTESTTVDNSLGGTIVGTPADDHLVGTNGADVILGLGGNDVIDGGNGDDVIYAGDGDDIVGGGNGNDTIYGQRGNDSNYGETFLLGLLYLFDNGDDTIDGGPGDDDLNGQKGSDTVVDHDGTDVMSGGTGPDIINVADGSGGDTANGGLGSDTCLVDFGDQTISC